MADRGGFDAEKLIRPLKGLLLLGGYRVGAECDDCLKSALQRAYAAGIEEAAKVACGRCRAAVPFSCSDAMTHEDDGDLLACSAWEIRALLPSAKEPGR